MKIEGVNGIGEQLKQARAQTIHNGKPLSLRKLAKMSGVHHQTIYLIENGRIDCKVSTAAKLANALGFELCLRSKLG